MLWWIVTVPSRLKAEPKWSIFLLGFASCQSRLRLLMEMLRMLMCALGWIIFHFPPSLQKVSSCHSCHDNNARRSCSALFTYFHPEQSPVDTSSLTSCMFLYPCRTQSCCVSCGFDLWPVDYSTLGQEKGVIKCIITIIIIIIILSLTVLKFVAQNAWDFGLPYPHSHSYVVNKQLYFERTSPASYTI